MATKRKVVPVMVRLDPVVALRLKKRAKQEERSLSKMAERIIREAVAHG